MKITTRKYYNYNIYIQNVTTLTFNFELNNTLAEQIADIIDYYMETIETTECYVNIGENLLAFENGLEQGMMKIIESLLVAYDEDINVPDLLLELTY